MKKNIALLLSFLIYLLVVGCDSGLEIVGMEIEKFPNRIVYFSGVDKKLDLTGGVVNYIHKEKTKSPVKMEDESIHVSHNINFNIPGVYVVELKRNNSLCKFPIQVVNAANWTTDSEIVELDKIKAGIENLISTGTLKKNEKNTKYSKPYVPVYRAVFIDKYNTIRKYIQEAGSDDSSLTSSFYYDQKGSLRLAFIIGGAVNGSQLEHRIYFSSAGKRIWESHRYIKGPGYTFPERWPDSEIITDPQKAFNH